MEELIDINYIVDFELASRNIDDGIIFTGFTKTRILFDTTVERWKITLLEDNDALMTMTDKTRIPIGTHEWTVPEDICKDGLSTIMLVISSCNDTEFTCDDGICIPIEER